MSRLGLIHMMWGFLLLWVSGAAGMYLAYEANQVFAAQESWNSWQQVLIKSAHGHSNLFGMIHILFGLTMPYAVWGYRMQVWISLGLSLGPVATGFLVFVKSYGPPDTSMSPLNLCIGVCLGGFMVALGLHVYGLGLRVLGTRRKPKREP